MIFGIGVDIAKISRFKKWVDSGEMIERFFNEEEKSDSKNKSFLCAHYAKRFAAKEAFVKALGTGFNDIKLKQIYVKNNELGKPELYFESEIQKKIEKIVGNNVKIHTSLSDEKEYAVAFVTIEKFGEK